MLESETESKSFELESLRPNSRDACKDVNRFEVLTASNDINCRGFLVVLESDVCYPLSFAADQWKSVPPTPALTFELETLIPLDAEVIDYGISTHSLGSTVIATNRSLYSVELKQRRGDGGWLCGVCPKAALLLETMMPELKSIPSAFVIVCRQSAVDIFCMEQGKIVQWNWFKAGSREALEFVARHMVSYSGDAMICMRENPDASLWLIGTDESQDLQFVDVDIEVAIQTTADELLAGTRSLSVSLDRVEQTTSDRLGPYSRSMRYFGMAVLLFLLTIGGMLQWRSMQFLAKAEQLEQEQAKLFRELFPTERIPIGIRSRLVSEARQLEATRGATSQSLEPESVLPVVHAFLVSMTPEPAKFRWDSLQFSSYQLTRATGVAGTFAEFERLAENLRAAGFKVPPVSSNQVEDGVTMRLESLPWKSKELSRSVTKTDPGGVP